MMASVLALALALMLMLALVLVLASLVLVLAFHHHHYYVVSNTAIRYSKNGFNSSRSPAGSSTKLVDSSIYTGAQLCELPDNVIQKIVSSRTYEIRTRQLLIV